MAEKQLIYGIKVKTGNSKEEIKTVKEALDGVEDSIRNVNKAGRDQAAAKAFKELNSIVDQSVLSIQELGTAADNYKNIAIAAGRESVIGKEAIKRASELEKQMDETQQSVANLAAKGQALQGALQLSGTVVAGYTAFASITQLAGTENENLVKSIAKVQAATSLLASIEQVRASLEKQTILSQKIQAAGAQLLAIKNQFLAKTTLQSAAATKAFRTALIATGIGAIIVLIGALVANWDKLTAALGGATAAQKANTAATNAAIEATSKELSAANKLKQALQDETKTREDKTKAVKELQKQYPDLLSNIDAEKTSLEDINKALELNTRLLLLRAKQEALVSLRAEEFETQLKAQAEAMTGANVGWVESLMGAGGIISAQEFANAATNTTINNAQKQINVYDDLNDSIQTEIDKLVELGAVGSDEAEMNRKTAEEAKKAAEERKKQREEERKAQDAQFEKDLEAFNAFYKESKEVTKQAREEALKAEQEDYLALLDFNRTIEDANVNLIVDKYARQEEIINMEFERRLADIEEKGLLTTELELSILKDRNDKLIALDKAKADEEKTIADKATADKIKALDTFSSYAGNIIGAISNMQQAANNIALKSAAGNEKKMERIRKKQFQQEKALNIAQAVIAGATATIKALASGGPPAAIAAAVLAAAQIAKIASTQYQGTGGGADAGTVEQPTDDKLDLRPDDIKPNNKFFQGSTLNPNGEDNGNGPQKVVVIGSEIEAQLNKDKKAQLAATI